MSATNSIPVCLIREAGFEEQLERELDAMRSHFIVRHHLDDIQPGDLVIGRFGLRPFYADVEREINKRGASVLVSAAQAEWIEDLRSWYPAFADVTPRTWIEGEQIDHDGPFIVKGITSGDKHNWDTRFYAAGHGQLADVMEKLRIDMDKHQDDTPLIVREFVPLKTYAHTPRGLPLVSEYRYFMGYGKVLASGFYWQSYPQLQDPQIQAQIAQDRASISPAFEQEIATRLHEQGITLCVADIALTAQGEPILIELNDPSQAGLCGIDPHELYRSLRAMIG